MPAHPCRIARTPKNARSPKTDCITRIGRPVVRQRSDDDTGDDACVRLGPLDNLPVDAIAFLRCKHV